MTKGIKDDQTRKLKSTIRQIFFYNRIHFDFSALKFHLKLVRTNSNYHVIGTSTTDHSLYMPITSDECHA